MTMFQNLRRMLAEAATLKIACDGCGHEATWTAAQAFQRLGPDAAPAEIRRRLVCGSCGRPGRARIWI